MYLFILESIGTSELIMIGIVALIIFGPRKLPELMRSFGKAMAEFRRSTNEFKQTWEKEVDFESFEKQVDEERLLKTEAENTIGRQTSPVESEISVPEIKEIRGEDFERITAETNEKDSTLGQSAELKKEHQEKDDLLGKQDWL